MRCAQPRSRPPDSRWSWRLFTRIFACRGPFACNEGRPDVRDHAVASCFVSSAPRLAKELSLLHADALTSGESWTNANATGLASTSRARERVNWPKPTRPGQTAALPRENSATCEDAS